MSGLAKTPAELQSERDWLRSRVRNVGSYGIGPVIGSPAANAMVEQALDDEPPHEDQLPRNSRDLQACLNTLATAPAHLKPSLEETLADYQLRTGLSADGPAASEGIPVSDFAALLIQGEYSLATADLPRLPIEGYADDPLLAEWQWLRERAKLAGVLFPSDEHTPRSWGHSANGLVEHLLGGPSPAVDDYPHDGSDLAACEEAAKLVPEHLETKAELLLRAFRDQLERQQERSRPLDGLER